MYEAKCKCPASISPVHTLKHRIVTFSFNLLKQKYRRTPPALTKLTAYSKKMCPQPTFPTTITVFSSQPSRWSGCTRVGWGNTMFMYDATFAFRSCRIFQHTLHPIGPPVIASHCTLCEGASSNRYRVGPPYAELGLLNLTKHEETPPSHDFHPTVTTFFPVIAPFPDWIQLHL